MTLKDRLTRAALYLTPFLLVFAALYFYPHSSLTRGRTGKAQLHFRYLSRPAQNGEAEVLREVQVPDVLALSVAQQPEGNPNYVSSRDGEATQFSTASQYGNIGLLAHNHLSGRSFARLTVGQQVRLVFEGGKVEYFVVTEVLRFQALEPTSPLSEFRDMTSDELLSAGEVFERVYSGAHHVTFQTCIEEEGNLNWGRLFVLAMPLPTQAVNGRPR